MILGDLGAEGVIVDQPGREEDVRRTLPFLDSLAVLEKAGFRVEEIQ
jgi:hypothetical protein